MWMALAIILVAPLFAHADGKVFAKVAGATIPDQRALIHYANGVETLVVQTAFSGEGTNFAWVVPVPARPEVSAIKPWFFDNLEMVFRPKIYDDPRGAPFFFGIFHLFVLPLLALLAWVIVTPRSKFTLSKMMIIVAIIGLLAAISIPNFVVRRGAATASVVDESVNVLERKNAGIFETVTLSSTDGDALSTWLVRNGFHVSDADRPVIREYVNEKWFFVASRIRREALNGKNAKLHPLAFRFKTDKPVYPLRLTGVNNSECRVDLYVFGDSMAAAPGFETDACGKAIYPEIETPKPFQDTDGQRRPKAGVLRMRNPELRKIVGEASIATKLKGTLTSSQMADDAYLQWRAPEFQHPEIYARRYAVADSRGRVSLFLIPALLALIVFRCRNPEKHRPMLAGVIAVLLVGFAFYQWNLSRRTIVKFEYGQDPYVDFTHWVRYLGAAAEQMELDRETGREAHPIHTNVTAAAFHDSASHMFKSYKDHLRIEGFAETEAELGPSQFFLRETDDGMTLEACDIDGIVRVIWRFKKPPE
jgi:low affinity Fe/Cu permease